MSSHPLADQPEAEIDVKARLKALTAEEFSALQESQRYQGFTAGLRSIGWSNLFLGLLNIWMGTACCIVSFVHTLQVVGGLVLIVVSLWAIIAPSLRVMVIFNVLLLLFGIANIGISVSGNLLPIPGILGLLQFWWTYQLYKEYQSHKANSLATPSPELLRLYKATRKAINKAKLKSDSDLIHFNLKRYRWRGWLLDEYAAFWNNKWDNRTLFFLHKSEVGFAPRDESQLTRKRINGIFKLGDMTSWGDLKANSFERFAHWKPPDTPEVEFAQEYNQERRVPLLLSKIARGVSIVIILAALAYVAWFIWMLARYG